MAKRSIKKAKPGILSKIILGINMVLVVLLLLSYTAPYVDPERFWPVAFIGMAYLPLIALNAVFVVFWGFKKKRFLFYSLIAILIGFPYFNAFVGVHFSSLNNNNNLADLETSATDTGIRQIKVLSYNVHFFREFNEKKNQPTIKNEAIDLIASVNPDVVCMQEFYSRQKGTHDISSTFKKNLGYIHQHFHPVAKNNYEAYGLAIFSKYPIVSAGHLPNFGKGVNSVIYVDIEKNGELLRIYNVHLQSFGFQKEDYDFISGATESSFENNVTSTRRIGSRMKHAFNSRSQQAKALKTHLEGTDIPYLVLGDFNDTAISFAVNKVSKGLKNGFKEKGFGFAKTYNGDFPNFQIDYIFSSPSFTFEEFHIVKKKLSDHYPIWATLSY
jgi:endonuclease/exonuclease/phosphatase family metal-dependent hydrolase